jgi:hypothetical protein
LTEALIAFNDEVIYLLFFIVLPVAIILGLWGRAIGKENVERFNNQLNTSFKERIKRDFKSSLVLTILYSITMCIHIISFIKGTYNEKTFASLVTLCNFWFIIIIFREIRISYFKNNNTHISATYNNLIILCTTLFSIVISNALYEAYDIKHSMKFYGTQIITENGTIYKSDSTLTFVGKTSEYLFFYNTKTPEAVIIPCSKISKIILKKK